jgi:sterol desaturase/sphingolipid hydroxylase (fatty acid hydroxylase superfamily)
MSANLEIVVRVACYAAVFAAMALWEWRAPRRRLSVGRRPRWPHNLGILAVDIVAVRLLVPTAAVGFALIAAEHGWGLFRLLAVPEWAAIIVGVIALDLVIYTQHVVFHHVPMLWRVHRMHHADLDIDLTTGVRFHPIEILLSLAIKIAAVLALGVPAIAVLIFEVLLNATSMFNHSNVALPPQLDAVARWIVVTPQMHQVHHSIVRAETDSNFGFNLPWWDRLFGTYRAKPMAGEQGMTIGLPAFRDMAELNIMRLLTQPFRSDGNPRQHSAAESEAASMQAAEDPDQKQDRKRNAQ